MHATNILGTETFAWLMRSEINRFQLPAPFEGRCGTANRSAAGSSRCGGNSLTLNKIVHLSDAKNGGSDAHALDVAGQLAAQIAGKHQCVKPFRQTLR